MVILNVTNKLLLVTQSSATCHKMQPNSEICVPHISHGHANFSILLIYPPLLLRRILTLWQW